MTTDSNASKTNELMKDGIRLVRDGRYTDAYRTFREVVNRDPSNEHAWIWISQTSTDRTERKAALDRAFEINPNSEYGRQALARLEQEEAATTNPPEPFPARPGVIGGQEAPGQVGGAVNLNKAAADPNDLRSAISVDGGKKKGKGRGKGADPRSSGSLRENPQMVTQSTGRQKGGNRFRIIVIALLVLLVLATVVVVLVSKQTTTTSELPTATAIDTLTPGAGATTAAVAAVVPEATVIPTVATANPSPTLVAITAPATTAATDTAGNVALVATPTLVGGSNAITNTPRVATTPAVATNSGTAATGTTTTPDVATATPVTVVAGTTAATTAPATTTDQLNQAQQLVGTGDYKGAISLLNEVLKAEPRNVSANFHLGSAYLAAPTDQLGGADRFDEALKSFKRVTEMAPTWAGGYARLGETYAVKGDIPSAIAAFTRSLELDPNGPERWLALAGLYQRNNQPAEASYARSRAQGLNPTPVGTAIPVGTATPVTSTAIPAPTPTASR